MSSLRGVAVIAIGDAGSSITGDAMRDGTNSCACARSSVWRFGCTSATAPPHGNSHSQRISISMPRGTNAVLSPSSTSPGVQLSRSRLARRCNLPEQCHAGCAGGLRSHRSPRGKSRNGVCHGGGGALYVAGECGTSAPPPPMVRRPRGTLDFGTGKPLATAELLLSHSAYRLRGLLGGLPSKITALAPPTSNSHPTIY
eukprot:COSAG01_NODE_3994_length_5454_cov_344.181699_2_plen_199_part_00